MGCVGSKLDDSPAVALCRERCSFLDEAIHHRYALAEAHLAYFHSLNSVGVSLHRFFDRDLNAAGDEPPSPVLNLPPQRKGDVPRSAPAPAPVPVQVQQRHSHSNSGSHLKFHDSDEDSGDDDSPLHSGNESPFHQSYGQFGYGDQHENLGVVNSFSVSGGSYGGYGGGGGGYTVNYMQNRTTPSVVYQQRPMSPETIHFGEASSSTSTSYYNYPYANQNPSSNSAAYPYDNNFSNYGGFFGGSSSPPAGYGGMPYAAAPYGGAGGAVAPPQDFSSASTSKAPPPPPSPPRGSAWDFLNPFETFEKYYPPYPPSRDSREVREEEGIPDLEDEDYFQQEVVKEVHGTQKFVDAGGGSSSGIGGGGGGDGGVEIDGGNFGKKVMVDEEEKKRSDSELHYRSSRPSVSIEEEDAVEYEVHMVDKEMDKEEKSANMAAFKGGRTEFHNDSEVVREIQIQFERASKSGNELAKMLEVGKVPHNRKHSAYQVPSKMLNVITPLVIASSQPSTSKSNNGSSTEMADLDGGEELRTRSTKLSSTLHKLFLWEKKLFEEVKVEEKMRLLHEEKNRRLRKLDEKGAESHKIEATRTLVRSLSTKIRIAIQVVDKLSEKINNVRDQELWPQLNDIIQELMRMWRSMLECHHHQRQAIGAAKRLDAIKNHKHRSEDFLEATLQLERELVNWTIRFSYWFRAQKGFVRGLNNWLLKCLLYVPEETADGPVPFSPSRIGAPPVFIICNQWAQAMDRISEKEVVDSMRDFASNVLEIWERDKLDMRQRMIAHKNMERRVKHLEREDQRIHKELQVLDKRIILASSDTNGLSLTRRAVYQSETSKGGGLQASLQRVFEAMETFTSSSVKTYKELLQRIEEDRLARAQKQLS